MPGRDVGLCWTRIVEDPSLFSALEDVIGVAEAQDKLTSPVAQALHKTPQGRLLQGTCGSR
jgi:hypothetical protein